MRLTPGLEEFYNRIHSPRDGRFATSNTGGGHYKGRAAGAKAPNRSGSVPSSNAAVRHKQIGVAPKGSSAKVNAALTAVQAGHKVTLTQRQASMLVKKLGELGKEAAKAGTKAKNYDLCKITVPGTNLYCGGNKEIARAHMPQFSGKPVPGSAADRAKDKDGNVDGTEAFTSHMEKMGVKVELREVKASQLKATQSELVGRNVAQMVNDRTFHPEAEPIFVSRDGYVIDGHHRWAAQVTRDVADGHLGDLNLKVRVVDMDIQDVVKEANTWATKFGIAPKVAA